MKPEIKHFAAGEIRRMLMVGCGGTGSFLAEHLGRMIAGFKLESGLTLADGDTVEPANVWRQNFAAHEVGQNKAAALALRLAGRYGIAVETLTRNVDARTDLAGFDLVITATDTLSSRRVIAGGFEGLWLDVGNETNFGQAVIGTTHEPLALRRVWYRWGKDKGYVTALPDIAAVNPAILTARRAVRRTGCGQMPFAEQGFGINAMAALAASVLAKQAVVDGVVSTAAIYFDTDRGRMMPRGIDKDLFRRWRRKE